MTALAGGAAFPSLQILEGAPCRERVALKHFNITSEDCIDFKRAWALSNLRLLPKRKNLQKGARLEAPFQPSLGF